MLEMKLRWMHSNKWSMCYYLVEPIFSIRQDVVKPAPVRMHSAS